MKTVYTGMDCTFPVFYKMHSDFKGSRLAEAHIVFPKLFFIEVLTVVVMKSSMFWDIRLYSTLVVNRRLGETCRLTLLATRFR
jgi:hypothetical protein